MTQKTAKANDHAWEKEHAPKVGRQRLIVAACVYLIWVGFLVAVGANRWFGALQ